MASVVDEERYWIRDRSADAPFLIDRLGTTRFGEFLALAEAAAGRISGALHVINLCEHRPGFLAAFVGALEAGATTLMPPSRAPDAVRAAAETQPGCRLYSDEDLGPGATSERSQWQVNRVFFENRPALIGYTSGSSGTPTRHAKFWASLRVSTALNAQAIRAAIPAALQDETPWIVGTVPSQHMYGMETTVLLPLLEGMGLHAGRPLMPADIADALADVPAPRILVTTPAHVRAVVRSGVRLPDVSVVVSATAPLDRQLAVAVEETTGGRLVEMFGATETCVLGYRETAREELWRAHRGLRFTSNTNGTLVEAPWFQHPQQLMDVLEHDRNGTFRLLGRSADMIDIAGKRASLAEITQRLLSIEGVLDAAVFQPRSKPGLVRRLVAFAVAPGLSPDRIRAVLERSIDPVFFPRPLIFVAGLPRNAAGKLPLEALEKLLAVHEQSRKTQARPTS